MFPGVVIKKEYNLVVAYGGKIVINDSNEAMMRSQRIDALVEQAMATEIARRVFDRSGNNSGVVNLNNKKDDVLSEPDEKTLEELATEAALKGEPLVAEKLGD